MPSSRAVPPDPSGIAGPHDILAAEEFPPPAWADADTPQARARRLPPDPAGTTAPHDVLAADEFPPPAHADVGGTSATGGGGGRWGTAAVAVAFAIGLVVGLRRRR